MTDSSPKSGSRLGRSDLEKCPACGAEMAWRQPHGFPVVLQALFAVSFLAFLLTYDRFGSHRYVVWVWSAVQMLLGALLIRARLRTRKRVLHCIRCNPTIR
jgi:hypothetical protein